MSDISSLIAVYRMEGITPETRIRVIKKLGELINYSYAANIAEPIVAELVELLTNTTQLKDQSPEGGVG